MKHPVRSHIIHYNLKISVSTLSATPLFHGILMTALGGRHPGLLTLIYTWERKGQWHSLHNSPSNDSLEFQSGQAHVFIVTDYQNVLHLQPNWDPSMNQSSREQKKPENTVFSDPFIL